MAFKRKSSGISIQQQQRRWFTPDQLEVMDKKRRDESKRLSDIGDKENERVASEVKSLLEKDLEARNKMWQPELLPIAFQTGGAGPVVIVLGAKSTEDAIKEIKKTNVINVDRVSSSDTNETLINSVATIMCQTTKDFQSVVVFNTRDYGCPRFSSIIKPIQKSSGSFSTVVTFSNHEQQVWIKSDNHMSMYENGVSKSIFIAASFLAKRNPPRLRYPKMGYEIRVVMDLALPRVVDDRKLLVHEETSFGFNVDGYSDGEIMMVHNLKSDKYMTNPSENEWVMPESRLRTIREWFHYFGVGTSRLNIMYSPHLHSLHEFMKMGHVPKQFLTEWDLDIYGALDEDVHKECSRGETVPDLQSDLHGFVKDSELHV